MKGRANGILELKFEKKFQIIDKDLLVEIVTQTYESKLSRDDLIRHFLPLALKIANRRSKSHPNKSDDITAESLVALVEFYGITMRGESLVDPYRIFSNCINNRILKFLEKEKTLIKISRRTKKRMQEQNVHVPSVISDAPNQEGTSEEQGKVRRCEISAHKLLEFKEVVDIIAVTELEKQVLTLVIQGDNVKEISEKLGQSVHRIRQIKTSFNVRYDSIGD